jgi:hypothetical protein
MIIFAVGWTVLVLWGTDWAKYNIIWGLTMAHVMICFVCWMVFGKAEWRKME